MEVAPATAQLTQMLPHTDMECSHWLSLTFREGCPASCPRQCPKPVGLLKHQVAVLTQEVS